MKSDGVDLSGIATNDSPSPVNWRGKLIHVRPLLHPTEMIDAVNQAMSLCYYKEKDSMMPEMMDYAIRLSIILRYTDARLPEDPYACYKLLYLTDLYDTVIKHTSKGQADAIRHSVEWMMKNTFR